ncbi:MAG: hypothetical protein B7Z75_10415 [Acidocella sp. 20-57-95]|nr:MAG: hypothetical protein B7Z75_10415 [Acidocella sp. 20-57-95]OYV61417.1 MAG: hypothetical protein B7Z71_04645 [Acidocella sp. 21-58-7]HQT62981.1 hypothetical protein [Acidocella sp.]HQU04370.1 hypothetical protein [Acidocella sp.]
MTGEFHLRRIVILTSVLWLSACTSERHFAYDSIWPFGNPNGPAPTSETAQRALGHSPNVAPIAPQTGNVWPGAVQPIPTIADEQKQMSKPLGEAFTPSLPSPYPPGEAPPVNPDLQSNYSALPGATPSVVPGSIP